jgi:S1-C subfamily serine protease
MSNSVLQALNTEMADVAENVRRSLVHVLSAGRGVGAGTIWHSDGLIVTNAHVVGNGALQVVLPDGQTLPARLLAKDNEHDLAALAVEAHNLPTVQVGDSRRLQAGQWVMAVGHPWGVAGAVTAGVVIGAGNQWPEMPMPNHDWVAVNLQLRPGNSGGPLVDVQGRVIGINTIMTGLEAGAAVPVDVVKTFLKQALGSSGDPEVV